MFRHRGECDIVYDNIGEYVGNVIQGIFDELETLFQAGVPRGGLPPRTGPGPRPGPFMDIRQKVIQVLVFPVRDIPIFIDEPH